MIQRLQDGAKKAVQSMEKSREQTRSSVDQAQQTGDALKAITESVVSIMDMNTQIACAAEEQTTVAEEISRNLTNVADVFPETMNGSARTATKGEQMQTMAANLKQVTEGFKT